MEPTGSKLTNMPDAELVVHAIGQNQAAFIVLYTRYNAGVRSHISRYVAQKEDIEDICLESFQKAFSQISSYNPEYKFSTWLYRIARNTAFDHLSKHDREKNYLPTTSINEDIADAKNLVLDLKGLEYISSAGLRVLLSAQKKMGGAMKLTNVCELVMEVFEMTGFADILVIE